jgi:hypothetical protein
MQGCPRGRRSISMDTGRRIRLFFLDSELFTVDEFYSPAKTKHAQSAQTLSNNKKGVLERANSKTTYGRLSST